MPAQSSSVLDGMPEGMPEIERAVLLQDRVASVGFDWPDTAQVLAKLHEELAELEAGIAADDTANIAEEIGDLLLAVTNLARKLSISPTAALAASSEKFMRRFRLMEAQAKQEGRSLSEESLAQQMIRYQRARQQLAYQQQAGD